jgi:hypothetical protein
MGGWVALVGVLGAPVAAGQKPPAPPPPATPAAAVITRVFLAQYAGAPYRIGVAPEATFFNGDLVVVRGRNFGAQGTQSLRLRANGHDVAMTVSTWSDTIIRAHVPDAREFGIQLTGPGPQRRDETGVIGVALKAPVRWRVQHPVRLAFVWNWHLNRDKDGDGVEPPADCDDRDPQRHAGAPEVADEGRDEDCDPGTIGTRDADRDGYVDARVFNWVNGVVTTRGEDCDDQETNVNPRVSEACNGRDENCDGWIDEKLLHCPTANQRVRS